MGRPCKKCNDERKLIENATKEHAEIKKIVNENQDILLSKLKDYKNQRSYLKVLCNRPNGCNQEYEIRAQKIKAGQLHGCDKYVRGGITNKKNLKMKLNRC